MPLTHIRIENFKSIKRCDLDLNAINGLIGANGTGKTNILEAIYYFYTNLTEKVINEEIFDINNKFSNQMSITFTYDLSDFSKISKSNTAESEFPFDDQKEESKYKSYYKSIISLASQRKDKTYSLRLTQIKERGMVWSEPFEKRFIIKSLFPLFYINTRDLDITEWSQVWNILGELGKVSHEERYLLENKISDLIQQNANISGKMQHVQAILESSGVTIKSATAKEFAKNLAKIYFSGESIYQKGRQLNYYSTGTNSVKYIELLLRALNEIAKTKLKEPIILFDEPEISLHPSYVDELSDAFLLFENTLQIIFSTHSARLTKNIITNSEAMYLYNITLDKKYTCVTKMKKFTQYSPESKYRVTDDHVNSYFSKAILFVEGETELEFFANPYLLLFFPYLKEVDVFEALAQKPILNIMLPQSTNANTPYLCLIDLDKAVDFDSGKRQLTLRGEYFKDTNEKYMFRSKKDTAEYMVHLRKRIDAMAEKLRIHYNTVFYSCKDSNYISFFTAIHEYLLKYCIYTLNTTIEGSLINAQTYSYALEYLKEKIPSSILLNLVHI